MSDFSLTTGNHLDIIRAIAAGHDVAGLDVHGDLGSAASSIRPITGEQTNFSYIVDEKTIWKFYATRAHGIGQEVRIGRVLDTFVPPLVGYLTHNGDTVCVVTGFIPDATDLWQLREDPALAAHVPALGDSLGVIHRSLATAFGTNEITGLELATRLRARLEGFARTTALLDPYLPAAREAYAQLDTIASISVQEIHGDLHLGQILLADDHLYYLDFEGEPGASIGVWDSPLRDIAGLARSFHYAGLSFDEATFLPAYEQATGSQVDAAVLRAFVIDRFCYEVVYELTHRPTWVDKPLSSARLVF
ncbi:phosphotransferase [Corynebacterium sp. SCR221107]|uniref:phosphotransferase n=1 Tax=Corynebacterium sp. SCR221107 TaxID=3017361 RepID=UPI0022EC8BEE|nr:phosphotransferase [Corynebacterium sp. SCR221107]WBT08155.1 phosphotransferase [Corynebacterium sp. SCR221107]